MARRSESGAGGPGWFATLGGALLLVVLGFGVGLVAGAAYEEPDLVMDHLAGRSTDVPLRAATREPAEEGSPSAPVAAAGGEFDAGAPEEPERAASRPLGSRAEAPAAAPSVAAPPPGPGFAIQVGAFGLEGSANELAVALQRDGFPTFVERVPGGDAPFKVRVGPVPHRTEAERLAGRLKDEYRLPTWVLDRGKGG